MEQIRFEVSAAYGQTDVLTFDTYEEARKEAAEWSKDSDREICITMIKEECVAVYTRGQRL